MGTRVLSLLALASALSFGCAGESASLGLDEPILVHHAELKEGKLPGSRGTGDAERAQITSFSLGFGVLHPGTPNVTVHGRTTGNAYAVGLRFLDQGSGYWLLPTGAEDPTTPGELTFDVSFDAGLEIEPGLHELAVVAFDARGRAGTQSVLRVCVASDIPDNLNVCNRELAPPHAVVTLSWNVDSDLDLILVAPDGTRYDRSNRLLLADGKLGTDGKPAAGLDSDGVAGCLSDGKRRENFVWNAAPQAGNWLVYANLFDACGKAAVSFELRELRQKQNDDGTFAWTERQRLHGQLIRAQQNGGAGNPLYLTAIKF
jgi:hypothetical protein